MSQKKKGIGIAVGVIAIVIVGVFIYLNQTVKASVAKGRIMKGVTCDGIALGGKTKAEATKIIEKHLEDLHSQKIKLYVDDESTEAKVESLGVSSDAAKTIKEAYNYGRTGSIFTKYSNVKEKKPTVKVYRNYDEATFKKNINSATKKIITEPKNASVKRSKGKFKIIKEKTGYTLKVDPTFDNFKKAVEANKKEALLEVTRKTAKYTSKDMKQIKDRLATYTTYYGGSPLGRKANVANGAKKINGTVLYPGESFSVYKTVTPFNAENGYALAGSYENGATVQTYGGGICQVSTTLYNAAIRAELKIKERHPHSMTVAYVPRSSDAAIAGTYKDLKFENPYDFPIYIQAHADGASLTFNIFGYKKDKNRKVSFESVTTAVIPSSGSKTIRDSSLPAGQSVTSSGHTGYTAQLWKIVTEKGKVKSRKLFNTSSYMATPVTTRVGTGG